MKLYKLIVHTKNFSVEDLIINPKDFPTLRKGDIVEIYHPEDEFSRLLLQITSFKEDLQGRETISVEQSIATTFQLRTYNDVHMNVVSPDTVALDSVELIFKDQYLGRSEMWRLKKSLVNTCVYLNKKIEFCGGSVRCQVYEMWAMGDKVACGVITEDTKVVFRSSTAMVYLFIQMSSEMWDFDIHGDLYFEKAVNGFLAELFQKWKKHGSNHEVTIVLFSRLFYSAVTIEDFPLHMRRCLQQDYKGRFYEDFYRVVIQNERYDEWGHVMIQLRRMFTDYQRTMLDYHSRSSSDCPKASISTAAQGNFLEVLNISLNVFEKHFLERSFDRTGQLVVVITPGVGVFNVDRELTNVTKQRIIDNGVGCDLVCVGEQPLHAVPLLKFNNKDATTIADDYSMPHWINLSFFSSNKRVAYSTFIPRIKLPPRKTKSSSQSSGVRSRILFLDDDSYTPTTEEEYDAYDDQVFATPSPHTSSLNRGNRLTKKASVSLLEGTPTAKMSKRKLSDPDIHHLEGAGSPPVTPVAVNIPPRSEDDSTVHTSSSVTLNPADGKAKAEEGLVSGSVGSPGAAGSQLPCPSPARPGRALINPFDPSHVTIKLTSNRRRWSHIFPKGPTGLLIQQHHYQAGPQTTANNNNGEQLCRQSNSPPPSEQPRVTRSASQAGLVDNMLKPRASVVSVSGGQKKNQALIWGVTGEQEWTPALTTGPRPSLLSLPSHNLQRKSMTLLWGATGEQEWTPALTTVSKVIIGVDWKSLTIPACLPITTDYFPDEVCLKTDYVFSDYNLLPDDVNADYAQQRAIYRKPLSTPEVFRELVSQRLAQGFQLIVEAGCSNGGGGVAPGSAVVGPRPQDIQPSTEYKLSIGRVFHRIVLCGSEIRVTRYRPRHPYPPFNVHYHYRFQAPDHQTYEMSWVSFNTEKLETYNWNYLDHYICTRGDTDFALAESLKYWRFRVYILPVTSSGASRKILEGSEYCDLYSPLSLEDQSHISETFLRFIETWINKIRRPAQKKSRLELAGLNQASQLTRRRHSTGYMSFNSQTSVANSPFRERLGSNRLPDKPRPRSGSKVLERGRASPAIDSVPLPSNLADSEHSDSVDDTLLLGGEILVVKEPVVLLEVVDLMKHHLHGLTFVSPHTSLPGHVFVSADAVAWVKVHVENVTTYQQAVTLLEDLRKEKLICHASGDFSRPFIVGFHLYHIVNYDPNKDEPKPLRDLQSFENEWLEVEVKPPQPPSSVPLFLREDLPSHCHDGQPGVLGAQYKHTHLEVDVQGKSDRVEWGHCRYQSVYRPDRAYELVIQWMAASGTVVCELISGWARKAQANQLLMIPIPPDPFALPFTIKSDVVRGDPSRGDPLRGPVFVPLETESLMGTKSYLFEEFPEETWGQRLVLFQEAIAVKFGFIACSADSGSQHHHHQYVHLTGNVFLMIPSMSCEGSSSRISSASSSAPRSVRRYPTYNDVASSPHHEYITRTAHEDTKVGFLWSWNHMVSRRWKFVSSTPAKSDEAFQNKLLSDFRAFCSNSNNRLKNFWETCWVMPT
ncbi:GATOR complex protein Iml1 isoform X3 [Macrosteles quadrilineatus]|uniref:GATOR complex protein Iml1 isoform X3 n=1 Tax=Macrosteles quadrilineatus TaxID=74068 RepID=UPI0023E2A631|nr:GATOR complex protein Iml1 isoform X3 [Macrosteles quadrilineatus]